MLFQKAEVMFGSTDPSGTFQTLLCWLTLRASLARSFGRTSRDIVASDIQTFNESGDMVPCTAGQAHT
jgi:hypothetical protein